MKGTKGIIREALITLVLAAALYIILQFVVQNSPVLGSSMEPTLQESGQRLLVSRAAYWFSEPQRGDIITFHPPPPTDPKSKPYIKRVIGLPGETVEIKSGKIYINGGPEPLNEPYIDPKLFTYTMPVIKVPPDCYFVLGDNRNVSDDSHWWINNSQHWITIPRANIIGKAWLSIWPPSKWGLAPNYRFPTETSNSQNAIAKQYLNFNIV